MVLSLNNQMNQSEQEAAGNSGSQRESSRPTNVPGRGAHNVHVRLSRDRPASMQQRRRRFLPAEGELHAEDEEIDRSAFVPLEHPQPDDDPAQWHYEDESFQGDSLDNEQQYAAGELSESASVLTIYFSQQETIISPGDTTQLYPEPDNEPEPEPEIESAPEAEVYSEPEPSPARHSDADLNLHLNANALVNGRAEGEGEGEVGRWPNTGTNVNVPGSTSPIASRPKDPFSPARLRFTPVKLLRSARPRSSPPRPQNDLEECRGSKQFLDLEAASRAARCLILRDNGKLDLDSTDGHHNCRLFLSMVEALAMSLNATCASRQYRDKFTITYKVLYKEGTLCYLTEILDSAQEGVYNILT
jgi:hypothetical protein